MKSPTIRLLSVVCSVLFAFPVLAQDDLTLVQYAEVFWAEKSARATAKDSFELEMKAFYEKHPDLRSPAAQEYIRVQQMAYDTLASNKLKSLCERAGVAMQDYLSFRERYYADPQYQNEVYPLLIQYAKR